MEAGVVDGADATRCRARMGRGPGGGGAGLTAGRGAYGAW